VHEVLLVVALAVQVAVEANRHRGVELRGGLVESRARARVAVVLHLDLRLRRDGTLLAGRVGSTRLPGVVVAVGLVVALLQAVEVDLEEEKVKREKSGTYRLILLGVLEETAAGDLVSLADSTCRSLLEIT
jgi:hypothetical protein